MRVLLADDERTVRSALRLLLEQQPGMMVVGEADNRAGLVEKVNRIRPDLVLLDWELPGESDVDYIQLLRDAVPNLSLIVLSGRPEARHAALCAGADAFISKVEPPERVLFVLAAVAGNDRGKQDGKEEA